MTSEWIILRQSFKLSTMGPITSLIFLILPWFSQYFFYMLNETLSLLGPPYLCTIFSFKGGSSPLTLKMSPFWFPTKNPKILFAPAVKEKSTVKQIV